MRGLMIGCAVALVLVGANTVMAADVSHQTLAAMGINGMEKMSDAQGMEVRGKGFVLAWGSATTFAWPASGASAGYVVGSQTSGALAVGGAAVIANGAFNTNWAGAVSGGYAR